MESGKIIDQRAIEELLDKKKKKKGKFIFVFLYFCGMKLFYSLSNKIIILNSLDLIFILNLDTY